MTGIDDVVPERESGYFAALERTTPIVQTAGNVPTTTSMRIANGTKKASCRQSSSQPQPISCPFGCRRG